MKLYPDILKAYLSFNTKSDSAMQKINAGRTKHRRTSGSEPVLNYAKTFKIRTDIHKYTYAYILYTYRINE